MTQATKVDTVLRRVWAVRPLQVLQVRERTVLRAITKMSKADTPAHTAMDLVRRLNNILLLLQPSSARRTWSANVTGCRTTKVRAVRGTG